MNDLAGLQALVEDVGSGNVIDAELLDGLLELKRKGSGPWPFNCAVL